MSTLLSVRLVFLLDMKVHLKSEGRFNLDSEKKSNKGLFAHAITLTSLIYNGEIKIIRS